MNDRELLQQALDALNNYVGVVKSELNEHSWDTKIVDAGKPARKAIEAIRTRLAQPEPEPVAWMYIKKDGMSVITDDPDYADGTWLPLYTAPPKKEWVGLTDEDRWELAQKTPDFAETVAAVEAKLKEKNA